MITVATIYDNRNDTIFDVSQVIGDIKIMSYIDKQPGKLTCSVRKTSGLAFWEGATISIIANGQKFRGFIVKKDRDSDVDKISITALDQLFYLKNKDSKVFENVTSDQIFARLCDEFVLQYKVVDKSNYVCAPRNNPDKPLYTMIQTALDDNLINTKQWFIIRDNFGVLEHVNINSLDSGVVIGDASGLLDFKYSSYIDDNVYNQIKLYRDNKETGKKDIFIVNDTINGGQHIKEWGILQLYEKVDENLNLAQIEGKARGMLSLYNNTGRSLKLDCLGVANVFAGATIRCKIKDLGDLSIDNKLLVTECTHSITNKMHTMSLRVELVI